KVAEGNAAPDSVGDGAITSTLHQQLPAARDVVDVQSCNSCHDSLSMHGGSRSQTQTCVTCHNPGNLQASSGRSMDFKVLIHRIHRGANLPSELQTLKSTWEVTKHSSPRLLQILLRFVSLKALDQATLKVLLTVLNASWVLTPKRLGKVWRASRVLVQTLKCKKISNWQKSPHKAATG